MHEHFFLHRLFALILSIFLGYFPIVINTVPFCFKSVLNNGEIIFSLIALLSICMFEVLEADLENKTFVLVCFVCWFIIIMIGIAVYIHQSKTTGVSYWKTNLICLLSSSIMYLVLYGAIAKNKKESSK